MSSLASSSECKASKGLAEAKVQEVLRAYKVEGVAWDSLVEPVQDALIQEFMRYYPKWRKTVCRACGCQSKTHVGRERGCLGVPNTTTLDVARIIDLCCDEAHQTRQVAAVVRKAIADGSSPLVDPSVKIAYTRPHYEVAKVKRAKSAKTAKTVKAPAPSNRRETTEIDADADTVGPTTHAKTEGDRAQAQALVQEMGQQVGAALAEVNQRTETNNQAIMAALNLLGNEVRSLRAENDSIRAQAAQALQASTQLYGATSVAADIVPAPSLANGTLAAAPSPGNQARTVVYIDDDKVVENARHDKSETAPGTATARPLARSNKNVFQLPTHNRQSTQAARAAAIAAAVAAGPKPVQGAPPSPLYPVLSRPTMQPRLASLAH
nr:hypothetical protein [Pandoravirus massiliensis]